MRLLVVVVLCSMCSLGQSPERSTDLNDACTPSQELLKYESMNLGVRIATSNPQLAAQFENALNFWTTVIDMRWHLESSSLCTVQLLDGQPDLFEDSTIAKAHLAKFSGSSGWVAFNPKAPLTRNELYLTAVHEIGHLLGLEHNPSVASVMYYTNDERADLLDKIDLMALSDRHRLRKTARSASIRCTTGYLTGVSSALVPASPRHSLISIFHQSKPNWFLLR
jgi:hypothetical protein